MGAKEAFQEGRNKIREAVSEDMRRRQEFPLTPCQRAALKTVGLGLIIGGNEAAQALGLGMIISTGIDEALSKKTT